MSPVSIFVFLILLLWLVPIAKAAADLIEGFTESVGMLIEASKQSASHPNDDKIKAAGYNAMQDLETNAAKSANIVKTTFIN